MVNIGRGKIYARLKKFISFFMDINLLSKTWFFFFGEYIYYIILLLSSFDCQIYDFFSIPNSKEK